MEFYKHSPDIGKDEGLFVSNDGIWIFDLKSGNSSLVVSEMGVINNARFSPDGNDIIFRSMTGKDASFADMYHYNRKTGVVRRVTYLNGKSVPRRMFTDIAGWKKNFPIISTDAYSPFGAMIHLYELNLKDLSLSPLNLGPASHILYSEDYTIIGRFTYDMPHWKGYKGGTKGVIWSCKKGNQFKKIVDLPGHVSSPCVSGKRLYFVSDHEGWGQIYSIELDGNDLKRHTNFKEHYPRHLSSNGQSILFSMAGELFVMDPSTGRVSEIKIKMNSGVKMPEPKFSKMKDFLEEYSLDKNGEIYSLVARGHGFLSSKHISPKLEIKSKGRVRQVKILDGGKIAYVRQDLKEEVLCLTELPYLSECREIAKGVGLIDSIFPSPDSKYIAFTDINFNLYVADTEKGSKKRLDTSKAGKIREVVWSHTGDTLAYTYPYLTGGFGQREGAIIRMANVNDGKIVDVTEETGNDFSPSFDLDGKFLYYLSDRTFDPVNDRATFNYSFPRMTKIYFTSLSGENISPVDILPEKFKLEGNAERKIKVTETIKLEAGNYSMLTAVPGGLLYMSYATKGLISSSTNGNQNNGKLSFYQFSEMKEEEIDSGVIDYQVSGNRETLLVRKEKNRLKRFEPKGKTPLITGYQKGKELRMHDVKMRIDLKSEWKQMFEETLLLATSYFWNEEFSKKNGEIIYNKYRPLIDNITSRFELSEIIREMQGEFRTSHCYETGGDYSDLDVIQIGHLGADFVAKNNHLVIEKIYGGDISNENEKSPLLLSGLREGDEIVSLNGTDFDPKSEPIGRALLGLGHEKVRIDALNSNGKRYSSYLETIPDDRYLRYRDWVEANRKLVHDRTGGKVGYLHIPNMMMDGLAEFYKLYIREFTREGLIVDVRFNGGGNVSQLILEKLLRERLGFTHPRRGQDSPFPSYSIGGPIVALTNENAGSDGDIFSHSFKLLSLGPLIGTRTWGGVIGISPERKLADGTMVTQPRFGLNFEDVGFGVENYGTDPTDMVEITPDDWRKNADPQMETALKRINEMMKNSKKKKVK